MTPSFSRLDHDVPESQDMWGEPTIRATVATPPPTITPQPVPASATAAPEPVDYVAPNMGLDTPPPIRAAMIPPSQSHKKAILKKLAQTVSVSRAYAAAIVERNDYAALIRANWDQIHLEDTIKSLRALITSEDNFAVIQKAHEKLAVMEANSATAARDAVCNAIRKRMVPLCLATQSLLDVAIRELDALASQARDSERALFEDWGMDAMETAISRSITAVRRELVETQKGLKMPEPMPHTTYYPNPEVYNHAIDPFSVS